MPEHTCGDQCRCPRHATPVPYEYEAWYGQHRCPRESEHGPITLYDADPTLRNNAFAQSKVQEMKEDAT